MPEGTSKLTVIIDSSGNIAAAAFSEDLEPVDTWPKFRILPAEPGQVLRELDVPSGFRDLPPDQLYARVRERLPPVIETGALLPFEVVESPVFFPPLEVPVAFPDRPEPPVPPPQPEGRRDETIAVGQETAEGCMTCAASVPDGDNPKVVGDLKDRQDKQPRVNPACDGTLRSRLLVSYFWRNKIGADFTGAKYKKQPDDASVQAIVENFDELVALVQFIIGQVATLPGSISAKGLTKVDNAIRDLLSRMSEVFSGKPDVDRLLGDLVFEFNTPKGANIGVHHTHDLEMYAKDSARCSFVAKLDIDGVESDKLNHVLNVRTDEQKPVTNPDGTPKIGTDGKPVTKSADGDGVAVTVDRGPRVKDDSYPLESGLHVLRVRMDLTAGNLGIANDEVKKKVKEAVDSAKDAVEKVLKAVTTALNALIQGNPIPPAITAVIKDTASAVLKAALDALSALVAALNALILESRSFVKLYGSTLQLTCKGLSP